MRRVTPGAVPETGPDPVTPAWSWRLEAPSTSGGKFYDVAVAGTDVTYRFGQVRGDHRHWSGQLAAPPAGTVLADEFAALRTAWRQSASKVRKGYEIARPERRVGFSGHRPLRQWHAWPDLSDDRDDLLAGAEGNVVVRVVGHHRADPLDEHPDAVGETASGIALRALDHHVTGGRAGGFAWVNCDPVTAAQLADRWHPRAAVTVAAVTAAPVDLTVFANAWAVLRDGGTVTDREALTAAARLAGR